MPASDATRAGARATAFRVAGAAALASLALLSAGGCSPQTLVVVDPVRPDTCVGGDGAGCVSPGLLDDLVGYWRFDDGSGSATARDGSGRGNNGALVGLDSGRAWVPGRSGTAIEFGGTGWIVVTPSASVDTIVDRVTVAAWVYLEGTIGNWATAESRQINNGVEQYYHISLNADARPSLFVTAGTTVVLLTAPDAVAPRTWVHLAGTYDGTAARLYVDGTQVAMMPLTGTFLPDTTPLILGGNGNDGSGIPTELFPGRVDEIMLYRRALTGDEILRLHAGALFSSTSGSVDTVDAADAD